MEGVLNARFDFISDGQANSQETHRNRRANPDERHRERAPRKRKLPASFSCGDSAQAHALLSGKNGPQVWPEPPYSEISSALENLYPAVIYDETRRRLATSLWIAIIRGLNVNRHLSDMRHFCV